MIQNINKSLELIEKSNAWIKTSLDGNKQKDAYRNIANCRRKLKKRKYALEENPAAAMYGESQKGKSYLVSGLLSVAGNPFSVVDANGVSYDFINQINPIGHGTESTSLVTRFSTDYRWIDDGFPIKATLLSPTDLALTLCDSYYSDLKINRSTTLRSDAIEEKIALFESRFASRSQQQSIICEDDIMDMQDYFMSNIFANTAPIQDARYFEEIAALIPKIKPEEWPEVFSVLWNENKPLTELYATLITHLGTLNYDNDVYLPMEAVLRNKGTLLDVSRLKEIYEQHSGTEANFKPDTSVLYTDDNGQETVLPSFPKSFLCALVAELVFRLPSELIDSKPFLANNDLLDFPGARHRLGKHEEDIEDKIIHQMLLRGKVAFLFNKYSDSLRINTLLFCHDNEQSAQSAMPETINRWIGNMIGDTPQKRNDFFSPVPPLFVIATKFNIDLKLEKEDGQGRRNTLDDRWHRRFERVLEKEIFGVDTYEWLRNWSIAQPNFQNIYLLRDYHYSSEGQSNIFRGYPTREIEEIIPNTYPNFRSDLQKSFVEYPFVKRHFSNPEKSWNSAASLNCDGSQFIIDQLTIASEHINEARRRQFQSALQLIQEEIITELLKFFHTNDKDEDLQKAKSTAGNIQHRLDTAFRADGIKHYGRLMKELMLDEGSVLELYRKKVDDIEHRHEVNMDIYSTYRIQVPVIENDTVDVYFERLCKHYEKTTDEQKEQFRAELYAKQVDLEELIKGNADLIKNNADQLAEALIDYWFAHITLSDKQTIQQILADDNSPALQEITEMFQKLFKKLNIAKRIAEKIRRYVEGHSKTDLPYEIVADISAELLNKCINTVGFEYLDESEINDLKQANAQNNLGLTLEQNNNPTESSVDELFTKIENWTNIITVRPEEMKTLPSYRNYIAWYNRLKAGFVFVCDIPNYDVTKNQELGAIINDGKSIKY